MTGFMVKDSGTQTIGTSMASPTELDFDTVLADPDSGFASNRFTIPASWNAKQGRMYAGFRASTILVNLQHSIERSTDSGSNWTRVATYKLDGNGARCAVTTPVLEFATGDIYRCTCAGSQNKEAHNANFFGGHLSSEGASKRYAAIFGSSTRLTTPASTMTRLNFANAEPDPQSLFATGGGFEVPSGFGDCWGVFKLNMKTSFQNANSTAYLISDLASGVNVEAQMYMESIPFNASLFLGPVPMTDGDQVAPWFITNQNLGVEIADQNTVEGFIWPR